MKKYILVLLTGLFMAGCKTTSNIEKLFIDINESPNGMFISSTNENNPVLLFISGGPGVPEFWLNEAYAEKYPNHLSNMFTVCYWDYFGEGLSYNSKIKPEEITTERLAKDAVAVADYLRDRFGKDKIYLMAHSSGTHLGLYLAQNYPQNFYCYFAMGQDAVRYYDDSANDRRIEAGYNFLKPQFEAEGNTKALKMMEKLVYEKDGKIYVKNVKNIGAKWESVLLAGGCGTTREMRSDAKEIFFPQMKCSCYTSAERINYWKGKMLCEKSEYSKNIIAEDKAVLIPIIFLSGYYDYTTPVNLAYDLYEKLEAPEKAFYTFNNSAHSPLWEENASVLEIMGKYVR